MYSCFIAYHGTISINGTEVFAKEIQDTIDATNLKFKAYCGPGTDYHTFVQHKNEVIPFSNSFLLVVNDFCPCNEFGAMDNRQVDGGAGYLHEEVSSYRALIKEKRKNVKTFAIYYCGNKRKTYDEKLSYVRTLLSSIDPDDTLYTGNNYYLINLKDIPDWVNKANSKNVILNEEYVPFEPLEYKVREMVKNQRGAILIEMKKGMGKTRFIKHIQNDLFPSNTITIFFNRDEGYTSLGKFRSDFIKQLIANHEEKVYLDDYGYGALNKENFASYINDFKEQSFGNEPMIICLDSVDDCKSDRNGFSVLELFKDLSLFDRGIIFVFTAKLPENGKDYTFSMYKFLESFRGERIKVDDTNLQYLGFLYNYYTSHIVSKIDSGDFGSVNPKILFDSFKPKDMLSFSILFKVVSLYLGKHKKPNIEIIESIESALKYYYSFLKENSKDDSDYNNFLKGLLILSMVNEPISLKDLDSISLECFYIEASSYLAKHEDALSILVNITFDNKETLYEIRHEKLKELIENDYENELSKQIVIAYVNDRLNSLKNYQGGLYDFLDEYKSVRYLINSYLRNLEDLSDMENKLELISHKLINLTWSEPANGVIREQALLNNIVSADIFDSSKDLVKATILSRLAIDEMIMMYMEDSKKHCEEALTIFDNNIDELSNKELHFYVNDLETYNNLCWRIEGIGNPYPYAKKCLDYTRILYERKEVGLVEFANTLLAYANTTFIHNNDPQGAKDTLDETRALLEANYDEKNLWMMGLLYVRYGAYYARNGEEDKVDSNLEISEKYYIEAFEKVPETLAPSPFIEILGVRIGRLQPNKQNLAEAKKFVKEREELVLKMSKQLNYSLSAGYLSFYNDIANMYLRFEAYSEAKEYFNKVLSAIDSIGKGQLDSSFIAKIKRNALKRIAEMD